MPQIYTNFLKEVSLMLLYIDKNDTILSKNI